MKQIYNSKVKTNHLLKSLVLFLGFYLFLDGYALFAQTYTVPYSGSNSITTCSGTIYDNGGTSSYSSYCSGYTVIYPGTAGAKVRLNGSGTTESCCDYLYIYNGVGTGGTQLYSGRGSISVSNITSTDASGALTVYFSSDGSIQYEGFALTISCYNPMLACASLTSPADNATGIGSAVTFQWNAVSGATGYRLYLSTTDARPASPIATTGSTSYYKTGLIQGTTYYWWVIPYGSLASPTSCEPNVFLTSCPNPLPAPTVTSSQAVADCGDQITLTASGSAGTYRWYADNAGTQLLAEGPTYTYIPSPGVPVYCQAECATSLPIQDTRNYSYTGSYSSFTVPNNVDEVTLQVWGAQGGTYTSSYPGGKGGYATGVLPVSAGDVLYIYVGQKPTSTSGGYNGGGSGKTYSWSYTTYAYGGGGATDIRVNSTSLYGRVIVGGGGSGATSRCSGYAGGGSQSLGYSSTYYATQSSAGTNGSFGQGANATASYYYNYGPAGGGGGWYGGGTNSSSSDYYSYYAQCMGGGSGYVNTSSSYHPSGYLYPSSYHLSNASMIAGNLTIPTPTGGTTVGWEGHGYARISYFAPGSSRRSGLTATIIPINSPATPIVTADPVCAGHTTTLRIQDPIPGITYGWFSDYACQNIIQEGTEFTTPALYSNQTYYVRSYTGHMGDQSFNFSYTGGVQTYTVPDGVSEVTLDVWGAQGGYRSSSTYGGKGGYSTGTLAVTPGSTLYVYVGGSGNTGGTSGGFNGGGGRGSYYGGGGATHIATASGVLSSLSGNRAAVKIVAGGGGSDGASSKQGMYGGGSSGGTTTEYFGSGGGGGTQSSGGDGGSGQSGSFGQGGYGYNANSGYAGAGGGGWYGGGGSYPDGSGDDDRGGGGGSGYIGGVTGAYTYAGNNSFLSPSGSYETGHAGNGYARVTINATDVSCMSPIRTVNIAVNPNPSVSVYASQYSSCNQSPVSVYSSASGATSYHWSSGETVSTITVTPGITTTYTLTVANQYGCTASDDATITVDAPLVELASSPANTMCVAPGTEIDLEVEHQNATADYATEYQFSVSNVPFTSISGTSLSTGDYGTNSINLPFTFNYCGNNYSSIYYTADGYIYMGNSSNYGNRIAALSADLVSSSGYYTTQGTAPNRVFIIQQYGYRYNYSGTYFYFQIKLYESTNQIQFHYGSGFTSVSSSSYYIDIKGPSSSYVKSVIPTGSGTATTSSSTYSLSTSQVNYLTSGTLYTFSPIPPCTYTWNTGATTDNISVTPTEDATYTVTVSSDDYLCDAVLTREVTVVPTVTVTADPPSICAGGSSVLTASGADSYVWENSSTANPRTVYPAGATTYTVTGTTEANCSATDNVTITIPSFSAGTIAGSEEVCVSHSLPITIESTADGLGGGVTQYRWYRNGNLLSNSDTTEYIIAAAEINGLTPATYTYTREFKDECRNIWTASSGTFTLTVNPAMNQPSVAGARSVICGGSTTLTASGVAGAYYRWYADAAGTELIAEGATLNVLSISENTTYYVQAYEPPIEGNINFAYTGGVQSFTVPAGISEVTLEVWGAQGGSSGGGNGGYSRGTLAVSDGQQLFVYVGGMGSGDHSSGGYNGGGNSNSYGGSGGGATDIARWSGSWNTSNHYNSRIIVAGGGGGAGYSSTPGGYGGGLNGGQGGNGSATGGYGGGQVSGGSNNTAGYFGSASTSNSLNGGGGGGGWYGGASGMGGGTDAGGGGGSGYIGGVQNGVTIAGNSSMPNPSGGTMTGRTGSGYARISYNVESGCPSILLPITVTVEEPEDPQVQDVVLACGTTTTLTVGNYMPELTYRWYSDAACTNLVYEGAEFDLPVLENDTTFYVKSGVGGSSETIDFTYTGSVQTYTVPSGVSELTLEVWGAQGGDGYYSSSVGGVGGKGGYATGTLSVSPGNQLKIYVGGQGTSANSSYSTYNCAGGFNGGGNSGYHYNSSYTYQGGGGGGATDVRLNGVALSDRKIVAGGGGGGGYSTSYYGGAGGGLSGTNYNDSYCGYPGTQSSGGIGGGSTSYSGTYEGDDGSFGMGGRGGQYSGSTGGAGGGGGYYGGGGGRSGNSTSCYSGGGGSGYIGGVTGGQTIAGNTSMPNPAGGTMTGREGNGFARITPIGGEMSCESNAAAVHITITPPQTPQVPALVEVHCGEVPTLTVTNYNPQLTYHWYSDAECTDLVYTGATYSPSGLENDAVFYVKSMVGGTMSQTIDFSYTGTLQTYTVPSGVSELTLEVWGAQGGVGSSYVGSHFGGKGGYSVGTVEVDGGDVLYVAVGGAGGSGSSNGWNGGGVGGDSGHTGAGGGATHIASASGVLSSLSGNRSSVLIVAGGGGGEENCWGSGYDKGVGGGLAGGRGYSSVSSGYGTGGTQSSGGYNVYYGDSYGSFGQGGYYSSTCSSGGGGGWYGGGGCYGGNAGGGSGYIGGVTDAQTIAGNLSMPNPAGGTMTGREGNGFARITVTGSEESCPSPVATVRVNVLPVGDPEVDDVTITCGETANLYVNDPVDGYTYSWYADEACTQLLHTGDTWSVENIPTTTTYYVKSMVGSSESAIEDFSYTGSPQTFIVPAGVSEVTLEVWGAQGGGNFASQYWGTGGKGGYSIGNLSVSGGDVLKVYVGQGGFQSASLYAFNGGGYGNPNSSYGNGATGGGATDIRMNGVSLNDRVIVAGGGGGASGATSSSWPDYDYNGGAGGGSVGIAGTSSDSYRPAGTGGTQSSGGSSTSPSIASSFGLGACVDPSTGDAIQGGGGGGGWYGGGAGGHAGGGGGGGSGYIGGVTGGQTIAGNLSMPNPVGGTMTGRAGNGFARISYAGVPTCLSGIVPVVVTVNPIEKPNVIADTISITCGLATQVMPDVVHPNYVYRWYSDPECTQMVCDGYLFSTPQITNLSTYYVKAYSKVLPPDTIEGTPIDFSYSAGEQIYTVPSNVALVKLEVWGAQGGGQQQSGNSSCGIGGKGGYSVGNLAVSPGDLLYVYVGGQGSGSDGSVAYGGWNGGGSSYASSSSDPAAGGGGATDIRIGGNSLYHRLIVAGGGGGGGEDSEQGGYGGGLSGGVGLYNSTTAGTQVGSGTGGVFGLGACTPYDGGAGGGGWYGGGTNGGSQTIPSSNSSSDANGGNGGSGYVNTADSYHPSGYLLDSRAYYLSDAQTIAGDASMPDPMGNTVTGRAGNGYARITPYYIVGSGFLCESETDTVTFTVTPIDGPSFAFSDPFDAICQGSSANLYAYSSNQEDFYGEVPMIVWYSDEEATNQLSYHLQDSFFRVFPMDTTTYYAAIATDMLTASGNFELSTPSRHELNGLGAFFDVQAGASNMLLNSFEITPINEGAYNLYVYYKSGSCENYTNSPGAWTSAGVYNINFERNTPATVTLNNPIEIGANQKYALYISTDAGIYYNDGGDHNSGDILANSRFMTIYHGYGVPLGLYTSAGNFYDNLSSRDICITIDYELNDATVFGCVSEDKFPITVFVAVPPTPADTILGDTVVCAGNPVTLTAAGGMLGDNGYYEWFTNECAGDDVLYETAAEITVYPAQTTTYYVRRKSPSCDPTDCISKTVYVNAPPMIGNVLTPEPICHGDQLPLTNPTLDFVGIDNDNTIVAQGWQYSADGATFDNFIDLSIPIEFNGYSIRYMASTNCGISYSNVVNLVVDSLPTIATLQAPAPVCYGNTIDWNSIVPAVDYHNNSGRTIAEGWSVTIDGNEVIFNVNEIYPYGYDIKARYWAENECGRTYSNEVDVIIYDIPRIDNLAEIPAICAGDTFHVVSPTITDDGGITYTESWEYASEYNGIYTTFSTDSIIDYSMDNYFIRYVIGNECGTNRSNFIQVVVNDKPYLTDITDPDPRIICSRSVLNMTPSTILDMGGLDVINQGWIQNSDSLLLNYSDALPFGLDRIIYDDWNNTWVRYYAENGCGIRYSRAVEVFVHPDHRLTVNPLDTALCFGTSIELEAVSALHEHTDYTWEQTRGGNLTSFNGSVVFAMRPAVGNQIYTVMATDYTTGCSQMMDINVEVYPVGSDDTLTICASELPYIYGTDDNRIVCDQSGIYYLVFQSQTGCDSVVTLHLNVDYPIVSRVTRHFCEGETFLWYVNRQVYTETTRDTIRLLRANGCDSIVYYLDLIIDDEPYLQVNSSEIAVPVNTPMETFVNCRLECEYSVDPKVAIEFEIYKDGELVGPMGTFGQYSFETEYPIINQYFGNNMDYGSGEIPGSTYTMYNYAYDFFYLNFFKTTNNKLKAIWHEPGEYKFIFRLVGKDGGVDYPYMFNDSLRLGGAGSVTNDKLYSIDSLTIIVHPVDSTEEAITICESELPYDYYGTEINSTGDYEIMFNEEEYFEMRSLHVEVVPTVYNEFIVYTCDDHYTWDGADYTTSSYSEGGGDPTPFQRIYDSEAGCDSVVSLYLLLNATQYVEHVYISACDNYTWDKTGITYTESGDYDYFAYGDEATYGGAATTMNCDTTLYLHLTINYSYPTTESLIVSSFEIPYDYHGVELTTDGIYTIPLETVNGCDSTITLNFMVASPSITLDTLLLSSEVNVTNNFNMGVDGGNLYSDTKVALDYEIYRNGVLLNDVRNYGTVNFDTYYDNLHRYVGRNLTASTGSIPTNTFSIIYYQYNYFYLHYMEAANSRLTANWQVPGYYTIRFNLIKQTGGQDIPLVYGTDDKRMGGQRSSNTDVILATREIAMSVPDQVTHLTIDTTVCTSQLPFVYHGVAYTEPIQTTLQFTDPYDVFDTTVDLNLTIYPSYDIRYNEAICYGADYQDHGFNLPFNMLDSLVGDMTLPYQLKIINNFNTISGCDSTITLYLTIFPEINIAIEGDTTICAESTLSLTASGCDSYLWGPMGLENNELIVSDLTQNVEYTITGTKNQYALASVASVAVGDIVTDDGFIVPADLFTASDKTAMGVIYNVNPLNDNISMLALKEMTTDWSLEVGILANIDSRSDGRVNVSRARSIGGWRNIYHAFYYCDTLRDASYTEWTFPAVDEFVINDNELSAVNASLLIVNGMPLNGSGIYLTSTEYNADSCYVFDFTNNVSAVQKNEQHTVRAISRFNPNEMFLYTMPVACTRTNLVLVTVLPLDSVAHATATICQGEEYNEDGFTISSFRTREVGIVHDTIITGRSQCGIYKKALELTVTPTYNQIYGYLQVNEEVCEGYPYQGYGFLIPVDSLQNLDADNNARFYSYAETSNGCDSITELILHVIPTKVSHNEMSYCYGTTYSDQYRQFDVVNDTILIDTLSLANGCDSIAYTYVIALPNPTIEIVGETTLCYGADLALSVVTDAEEIFWSVAYSETESTNNELTIPEVIENQIVNVTLTTGECVTSEAIEVVVRLENYTIINDVACAGSHYAENGFDIVVPATADEYNYQMRLTDANGCDSTVYLFLTANPVDTTEVFVTVTVQELPYHYADQLFYEAGTYNVTIGGQPCNTIDRLHLTVIDDYNGEAFMLTNEVDESTYSLTAYANEIDLNTKVSINYTVYKNGVVVNNLEDDCGGRLNLSTYFLGNYVGSSLNNSMGNIPTNTFNVAYNQYNYFYFHFLNRREHLVTHNFTLPGEYEIRFDLLPQVGGINHTLTYVTDSNTREMVGGKNSTDLYPTLATTTIRFTIIGEAGGGTQDPNTPTITPILNLTADVIEEEVSMDTLNVLTNGYNENAKVAINYTIYENDEPISMLSTKGNVRIETYYESMSRYLGASVNESGSMPSNTFVPSASYTYNYFYLHFLNSTHSRIAASWTVPGEYKIVFNMLEMTNGTDYGLTWTTDKRVGGKNAQNTGLLLATDTLYYFVGPRLSAPTGIGENAENAEINIYPNPAQTYFMLTLAGLEDNATISVTDVSGKLITAYNTSNVVENQIRVDVNGWSQGVYFVTLRNGDNLITKKLVITK